MKKHRQEQNQAKKPRLPLPKHKELVGAPFSFGSEFE